MQLGGGVVAWARLDAPGPPRVMMYHVRYRIYYLGR
jgi:hypothetical protein